MNYDDIRQHALNLEQDFLQKFFEPLVQKFFIKCCESYPKRDIELLWGMGTFYLNVEQKTKKKGSSFSPLWSSYTDMIEDKSTISTNFDKSFLDNSPIFNLVTIIEECHDIRGYYLHLDTLKYNKNTKEIYKNGEFFMNIKEKV